MAEFFEVMKQIRRMCWSASCNNCILPRRSDEMCILEDAPAKITDEEIAEIEAKTMKWAAEHPELRYPTWEEWQQDNFRDAASMVHPCMYISYTDAHCRDYKDCGDCANQPIPADIAKKLGIQPIAKENSG